MARILMPTMARRYNANPKGSSTTTVTMKSNNPFESRVALLSGGALPGMSGLGEEPGNQPATTPAAAGFDWTALAQSIAGAGVQVGGQLATNRIQQLYGPKPQQLTGPGAVPLPIGIPYAQPKSWMPWAIMGGGVVLAGVMLFAFRGGKKKR